MSHPDPRRRAVLSLILATAAWGLGAVISKRAVEEIPPLTLLPIQLSASVLALSLMRLRGVPIRDHQAAPLLARLGLLNPGLAYGLSLIGLTQITASLSVLLWAVEPLLILLLASFVLRERLTPSLVALILVSCVGLALVVNGPAGAASPIGVVLTIAGIGCCAIYTVVARRLLPTATTTLPVVLSQQAYALALALVILAALWLGGGRAMPGPVSTAGWVSAITSGVLYYGVAYWLYLTALRDIPASLAAASFYLIPLFGVAGSIVLLGEHLDPAQAVGGGIVLVAVFAVLRRIQGSGAAGTVRVA